MVLLNEVKDSIKTSVLCWLATIDRDGSPNVSPKEIFNYYNDKIIIANIASPQSEKNIVLNENVCVSFVDVIEQHGFKIKGKCKVLYRDDDAFLNNYMILSEMTGGKYPILSIFEISISSVSPILAPSYLMYPDQNNDERRRGAIEAYRIKDYLGLI